MEIVDLAAFERTHVLGIDDEGPELGRESRIDRDRHHSRKNESQMRQFDGKFVEP